MSTAQAELAGIGRGKLAGLIERGLIERVARGLYRWRDASVSEHHSMALTARIMRGGVVCLLSALRFHELTTQQPHEIWLTVDRTRGKVSRRQVVPMRIFYSSGRCFSSGVERHRIEGVTVRIYSVAKTVVDCFKYRSEVGLDVALEALREGWSEQRFEMDELHSFARICRVANVMRPYIDSII